MYKKFTFILAPFLFLLFGCNREESIPEVKPLIKTSDVRLTSEGVVLSGEFILSGTYRTIHYGFQLDTDPSFNDPIVIEAGSNKQPDSFEAIVATDLQSGKKYYVRTWAKSEKYDVLGNRLEFANAANRKGEPAPLITKVTPETALWGDTIMIIGKYFDFFGFSNKVLFNGTESKVWNRRDTIWAIIPNVPVSQDKINMMVKVDDKGTENQFVINLTPPVFTGLSKSEGQYPDTIVINGDNFTRYSTSVLIDGVEAQIVNLTKKNVSFVFPYLKEEKKAKIELSRSIKHLITNDFQYHGQAILQLSKDEAWIKDTIKLYGKNIDFKRILTNIKNPDPKLLLNYTPQNLTITNKWKDSIQFILNGVYDASKFNLEVQFGKTSMELPYTTFTTIDQKEVIHKAPLIEPLEKNEYVYRETVNWKNKGMYFNCGGHLIKSLDGQISIKSYESNTHPWNSGDLKPGEYSLQLYSFDRLSNIEYFTVKAPSLESVSPTSFNRDNALQIKGVNLPIYSDCLFTHIQSGRIITVRSGQTGDGTNTSQLVGAKNIFGKGDYQLEIKIGDKSYKYSGTIFMNDYFEYYMKTTDPVVQSSSEGCGFLLNSKLYILHSRNMSIIDLNTGKVKYIGSEYFSFDRQPVFLNNKIYIKVYKEQGQRHTLCSFNESTEGWDETIMEGLPASLLSNGGIGVYNNHLIAISSNGDIYQLNQKWTLIKNIKLNLQSVNYIYSRDDKLYVVDFYSGLIQVVAISDWTLIRSIKMPANYNTSLRYIFEKSGEMYYCAKPGGGVADQFNFYKFTSDETVQALSPKTMDYEWYNHFCHDGKGNVYFVNNGYIYKFNPK